MPGEEHYEIAVGEMFVALRAACPDSAQVIPAPFDVTLADDSVLQPDVVVARAGCPHYWTLDPDEPSITAWRLLDGQYVAVAQATDGEEFGVTAPFEITLTPAALVR